MAQYKQGYAYLVNGSNIITSSGAAWTTISSGTSVFTIEGNYGYYFINSVTGPHYDEPYGPGNASGCYKLYLSAPYEINSSSVSGYSHYAITNDFTEHLGLPLVQKGDINVANIFSAALYKLDQVYYEIKTSGAADLSYLIEDFEASVSNSINQLSGHLNSVSGSLESNINDLTLGLSDTGSYLLNVINSGDDYLQDQITANFLSLYSVSGDADNNYSSIVSLENRVSILEDSAFGEATMSGLSGYVEYLSEQTKIEIEADVANSMSYLTGVLVSDISENASDIATLQTGQTNLINLVYSNSSKINSNSGIFNTRLIATGQSLIYLVNQLSGYVPTLVANGHSQNTDIGTSSNTFHIGSLDASKTVLGDISGGLSIKNYDNSSYRDIYSRNVFVNGNYVNFSDGNYLNQNNGSLYFNGVELASQTWVTGQSTDYTTLSNRVSDLESEVSEIINFTGSLADLSINVNSLQSQITDNDKDILEIQRKIAGSGIHGFKLHLSPYGDTDYTLNFGMTFSQVPYIQTTLQAGAGDPVIAHTVKSIDTTSMAVTFASAIPNSNYYLQVMAYDINS